MLQNKKEGKEEIRWYSSTTYVDIDTGEILTEKQVDKEYDIIHTKKYTHVYKTKGTIEYTRECRKSRQFKLFD